MWSTDSDQHWERLGRTEPYFGVLSQDRFKPANLDEQALHEFFQSGEAHVDTVLNTIRAHLTSRFRPGRCLDFGCGVGRLMVPLAGRFERAVGVDVSPSMLAEARRNAGRFGLTNVEFAESDDRLSKVAGGFDFIHSFIVMQHIPCQRGEQLLRALIDRLDPSGVAALHFTYARTGSRLRRWTHEAQKRVPLVHMLINLYKHRPLTYPLMQMNRYDLNQLLRILQANSIENVYLTFTHNDDGHLGVMLYFQKQ